MFLCQHHSGCLSPIEGNTEMCARHNREERKKREDEEKEKHKRERAKKMAEERVKRYREKAGESPRTDHQESGGIRGEGTGKKDSKPISFNSGKGKIKPRSTKRAREEREYLRRRKKYLDIHPICQYKGCQAPATEIHHRKGRIGKLLINVLFFLGVCAEHHRIIEASPEKAREEGYSLPRNN